MDKGWSATRAGSYPMRPEEVRVCDLSPAMPALQADVSDDATCVPRDGDVERFILLLPFRSASSRNPFHEAMD
jgi:hypothetical protein